ncbi:DUF4468 domain-containing protein [Acinetobacter pittii]|uniref:DUF4468 domain-containing protein n=1 Tax=Acinetobacter pittii TaxID=48296 RepID=UPI003267BB59
MKKLLSLLFISTGMVGCAMSPPMTQTTQPMAEVTSVVEVPNKSRDQIFEASKIWIAKSFKSANDVIQYADKSSGVIVGKGNIQFPCEGFISCGAFGNDKVNFTIKIETKDNKARINFSDITRTPLTYVQGGLNMNMGREVPIAIVEHQQAVTKSLNDVISRYKLDVNSNASNTNW